MMKFASKLKVQLPLALVLSLFSSYSTMLLANSADQTSPDTSDRDKPITNTLAAPETITPTATASAEPLNTLAISNIYLNERKQLVVEFDNPDHLSPLAPQIRDYPGEKHDIVLEFQQTSFNREKAPKAKAVLDELMKTYPELTSVAYATANDGKRARIRIGVLPNISAHPALAKIDENAAVINLDLPDNIKVSENDSIDSTSAPAIAEKNIGTQDNTEKPQAIANNTAANNIAADDSNRDSDKSAAAKTVSGIRGAWSASLKAGHNQVNKLNKIAKVNPLSKFSRNKQANKLSVPANSDIATLPTDEKPAPSKEKISSESLGTNPDSQKIAIVADNTPTTNTVITAGPPPNAQAETVPTEITPKATAPIETTQIENLSAAHNLSSLKPEIDSSPITKNDRVTSIAVNSTTVEKIRTELPRATSLATTEINKDEPIITPLSVEQVLKEKAAIQGTTPKTVTPEPEKILSQPVSGETKTDNPTTSDIKTDFPKPQAEAPAPTSENTDKKAATNPQATDDKKPETEKLASVPPNPLDSLTNAAIANGAGAETPDNSDNSQISNNVKLKSQRAHAGGKDYFPPKFADEAIEHYNAAVRAHLSGKLTEAITEYKEAVEADSKIAEAYSNLGLIYNQLHKYDQAMVEFHKALAINPKDAITYNGIGAAMRAKNNLLAAVKNWQTAISLDPNLASAHYNLGTAYELNKDLEKALAQYKEAVKYDDKLGEAYYRMGLILQKMNNKNLALQEYKRAVKISQQAAYSSDAKRRINLLSQTKNQAM